MVEVQIPAGHPLLSGNLTIPELDYCVKYSALDAGDIDRALEEMKRVGAILLKSAKL